MITVHMIHALSLNPAVIMATTQGVLLLDQTPEVPPSLLFTDDPRTPTLSRVFPQATQLVVRWEPISSGLLFQVEIGDGEDMLYYAHGAQAMNAQELSEFKDWLFAVGPQLGLPILFERKEGQL